MANQITAKESKLLFNALGANGLFSGGSGLFMVLASSPIAAFLGLASSQLIFELGFMLILFGTLLIYFYRRKRIHTASAVIISILDFAWVLASLAVVLGVPELLNTAGTAAVVAIAVVVLVFFDLQAYALWRLHRSGMSTPVDAGHAH